MIKIKKYYFEILKIVISCCSIVTWIILQSYKFEPRHSGFFCNDKELKKPFYIVYPEIFKKISFLNIVLLWTLTNIVLSSLHAHCYSFRVFGEHEQVVESNPKDFRVFTVRIRCLPICEMPGFLRCCEESNRRFLSVRQRLNRGSSRLSFPPYPS